MMINDQQQDEGTVFPEGFLWGVATAGYQVEGNIENNDWHLFAGSPVIRRRVEKLGSLRGVPIRLQLPGDAVQHGNIDILREDLDRAALLGLNSYRFSIEWSRIQPRRPTHPGQPLTMNDIDEIALGYYRAALAEMRIRNLRPIATLNHMTLPAWALVAPEHSTRWLGTAVEDSRFLGSLQGWENPATVHAFAKYAQFVAEQFQAEVDYWITINEPAASMVAVGYIAGVWPPGFSLDGQRARRAYLNLIKAHVLAYDAIKRADQTDADGDGVPARVGLAHALVYTKSSNSSAASGAATGAIIGGLAGLAVGAAAGAARAVNKGVANTIGGMLNGGLSGAIAGLASGGAGGTLWGARTDLHERSRAQLDYFSNYHFLDAVTMGTVDTAIDCRPKRRTLEQGTRYFGLTNWEPKLDFIGVNYYRAAYIYYNALLTLRAPFVGGVLDPDLHGKKQPHGLLNDLGWEIYPDGLYHLLTDLHRKYNLPIIVTENGIPETEDRNRAPYVVAHLHQIERALREGVPIQGYIHWTLVDNWEWQEAYRPQARFGLFTVDRAANSLPLQRHITEGAIALRYCATINGTGAAIAKFGSITAHGDRVIPPLRCSGLTWYGEAGGRGDFIAYFTQLPHGTYSGMIFYPHAKCWLPLTSIQKVQIADGASLTFEHQNSSASPLRLSVPARKFEGTLLNNGSVAGVFHERGKDATPWAMRRSKLSGLWVVDDIALTLSISDFENQYGGWRAKLVCELFAGSAWASLKDVRLADEAGSCLRFTMPDGTTALLRATGVDEGILQMLPSTASVDIGTAAYHARRLTEDWLA